MILVRKSLIMPLSFCLGKGDSNRSMAEQIAVTISSPPRQRMTVWSGMPSGKTGKEEKKQA